MNSLNFYYSYIKNPYATVSFINPPHFILAIENSIHKQIVSLIMLDTSILIYIPIRHYNLKIDMFENKIDRIRSPPFSEILFKVQLDMQYNGATI